jgi:hypothetical protein
MLPPITAAHLVGWDLETELLPRLEASLGRALLKNAGRFAAHDYRGADETRGALDVELKTRPAYDKRGNLQHPGRFDTWLVPSCKIKNAETRPLTIFYYYKADDSLWRLDYEEKLFASFERECPSWHPTKQEHLLIPAAVWSKVEV